MAETAGLIQVQDAHDAVSANTAELGRLTRRYDSLKAQQSKLLKEQRTAADAHAKLSSQVAISPTPLWQGECSD